LVGSEAERHKIEAAMAAIRKQVDGQAVAPALDGARRPKRNMSAAARRRIAAAQRKRWAAFHAERKTEVASKRRMSAATKAKLAANLGRLAPRKRPKQTGSLGWLRTRRLKSGCSNCIKWLVIY
jgi:hypothetical protein